MKLIRLALLIAIAAGQLAAAADENAEARKKLVGIWKGGVDQGATGHELTITLDRITGKRANQDLGEGSFKLDVNKRPWKMDATRTKGPRKGETYLGIYSLKGDLLKWCVSLPGEKRPTAFATRETQFLLILRRQKHRRANEK